MTPLPRTARRACAALMAVVGLAATAMLTTGPARAATPPPVSATLSDLRCTLDGQTLVAVTFKNSDTISHTVGIAFGTPPPLGPTVTRVLGPGASGVLSAQTDANTTSVRYFVDGAQLSNDGVILPCGGVDRVNVIVPSGITSQILGGCPLTAWLVLLAPRHGKLTYSPNNLAETIDIAYTADQGYQGPDQFQAECPPSGIDFHLLAVNVIVIAPVPTTRPSGPILANTGPTVLPMILLAGLLLAAGSVFVIAGRSRRRRV